MKANYVYINEMNDIRNGNIDIIRSYVDAGHPVVIYSKTITASLVDLLATHPSVGFQLTVTGNGGTWVEPNVRDPLALVESFAQLVQMLGTPDRLRLRIDPIIPTEDMIVSAQRVAKAAPKNVEVISSVIQWYDKTKGYLPRFNLSESDFPLKAGSAWFVTQERAQDIFDRVYEDTGLTVTSCGMPYALRGVQPHDGCISKRFLAAMGYDEFTPRLKAQRPGCKCVVDKRQMLKSGGCPHQCIYCYAQGKWA